MSDVLISNIKQFRCQQCDMSYESIELLRGHFYDHHRPKLISPEPGCSFECQNSRKYALKSDSVTRYYQYTNTIAITSEHYPTTPLRSLEVSIIQPKHQ